MEEYKKSLFIISAPSGAGKTSLIQAITQSHDDFVLSISHTTRPMRPGESDGDDYFFITKALFEQMIENNDFAEYAKVFGNYYGTSLSLVQSELEAGKDIILEIDWQGAMQIKKERPDCIMLFLLPPSKEELMSRLKKRGTDSKNEIQLRFNEALNDINQYSAFDKVFINKDVSSTVKEITNFIGTAPNDDNSFSEEVKLIIETFRSSK